MSLRELQCMARLKSHPNIVQMLEVIRCKNDWAFFVFEYMGGGDLLKWKESHQQNGTMPQDPEIRCILQQLFRALAYMHSHGIYHRDLKPENILLDGHVCKIADFSLSRCNDETEAVTECKYCITMCVSTFVYFSLHSHTSDFFPLFQTSAPAGIGRPKLQWPVVSTQSLWTYSPSGPLPWNCTH